jgi:hypothetical protein
VYARRMLWHEPGSSRASASDGCRTGRQHDTIVRVRVPAIGVSVRGRKGARHRDRVAAGMDCLRLRPAQAARARRPEWPDALLRSGDVELQRQRLASGMPGAPGPPHCDSMGGRLRAFSRLVLGGCT